MKKIEITEALISLAPGAPWTIDGEPIYQNIQWLNLDYPKPTESQVLAETARLQAEYDAKEYQRLRAKKYPSIANQLDMLWHAIDSGTLDKDSEFYTTLKSIKDSNPKPV
jgi:hypothetical protein